MKFKEVQDATHLLEAAWADLVGLDLVDPTDRAVRLIEALARVQGARDILLTHVPVAFQPAEVRAEVAGQVPLFAEGGGVSGAL